MKIKEKKKCTPWRWLQNRARAAKYLAERDKALGVDEESSFKNELILRKNLDDNNIDLLSKGQMTPDEYVVKSAQATASLVQNLGLAEFQGLSMPAPAALADKQTMMWVTNSIDNAFNYAVDNPEMDPDRLKMIYQETERLFNSTYGYFRYPDVLKALPDAEDYIDEDAADKLLLLEYIAFQDEMSDERKTKIRQALKNNMGFLADKFLPEDEGFASGVGRWIKSFFGTKPTAQEAMSMGGIE
jgi:hypothetical protein